MSHANLNGNLRRLKPVKNNSILWNLRHREITGNVSRNLVNHRGTAHSRMFSSTPARLMFSLEEIVDSHTLMEEAHVFLGFNRDGTHVISYTESFESNDQTGFPSYVYRLHWWLFRLKKKMIKLKTVRLFANEEIMSCLQLSYAEWPNEKSKVVVCGCSRDSDNCYITVSAAPPSGYCEECSTSRVPEDEFISKCLKHDFVAHMKYASVSFSSSVLNASGLQIDNLMVLNMGHSIGVISLGLLPNDKDTENLPLSSVKRAAYEDKPEMPEADEFIVPPSVDRSHDALLSPSLNIMNLNSKLQSVLDSGGSFSGNSACELGNSFQSKSEGMQEASICVQSQTDTESTELIEYDSSLVSTSTSQSPHTQPCISINDNTDSPHYCICNQHSKGAKNAEESESSNENAIDPYFDPEPKSIVLLSRSSEYDGNSNDIKCKTHRARYPMMSEETSENCCCGYLPDEQCSEHSLSAQSNTSSPVKSNDKHATTISDNIKYSKLRQGEEFMPLSPSSWLSNAASLSLKRAEHGQKTYEKAAKKICKYCGLKIREANSLTKDTLYKAKKKDMQSNTAATSGRSPHIGSPGRNPSKLLIFSSIRNSKDHSDSFLELNAPTPSPSASESSGSYYCTGDTASQASHKSGNCRRTDGIVSFFETLYGSCSGSGVEDATPAAENNFFYGPVTFEGADGMPLNPVRSDCFHSSVAYSQHLVLDVEHVIFDVLRTRCYTTYKFGYLIDYDVQIMDTCSNTHSVVILIVALLNVSPRKGKVKLQEHNYRFNSNFESAPSKSYQFQVFICWRLQTGRYEVVAASPLQPYHEKKSGKWDASWVVQTRNAIRRACELPQNFHCNVYVLNNSSVFRGKSLNYLWDTDRMIALRK